MSDTVELRLPARFRLVVEGPLEHQLAVLSALREVADRTGCMVLARAESPTEQKDPAPETTDEALAEILSWEA